MLNTVSAIALMAGIGPIAGHKFDANPQLPSWTTVSRAGNAMVWDATGKLTYAPNNMLTYSNTFADAAWNPTRGSLATGSILGPEVASPRQVNFTDAFNRANTSNGTIGNGWDLRAPYVSGYPLPVSTHGRIENNMFVADAGQTVYANRNVDGTTQKRHRAVISFVSGGGSVAASSAAILSSADANLIPNCVHVTVNRSTCTIGKFVAGVFASVKSFSLSPTIPADGAQHIVDVTIDGDMVAVSIDNGTWSGVAFHADFATVAGPWSTYEIYQPNASMIDLVRFHDIQIGTASTITASKFVEDTTASNNHQFVRTVSLSSPTSVMFSFYLRAAGRTKVDLIFAGSDLKGKLFDLVNGTAATGLTVGGVPTAHSITYAGNGWYRCMLVISCLGTQVTPRLYLTDGTTNVYTGDGVSGVYLYGARLSAVTYETSLRPQDDVETTSAAFYGQRWDYEPDNRLYFDASGAKTYKPNNQLLYSGDFSNAAWSKGALIVNETNILAPDGTNTATGLKASSLANGAHYLYQNATISQGTSAFCGSVYVKAGAVNRVAVGLYNSASVGVRKFFQLTGNGVAESDDNFNGGVTQGWTITNVGNDWYRISITQTSVVIGSFFGFRIYPVTDDLNLNYAATDTTTSQIFVWGPQLEHVTYQTAARPYRATTDAASWLDTTNAFNGLLAEEARTNSLRNGVGSGSAPGTPGTLPANWAEVLSGNLARSVVGSGVEFGMPYNDIRLSGTANGLATNIYFEATNFIAAVTGQTWTASVYARLVAGSMANVSSQQIVISERNSASTGLATTGTSFNLSSALQRLVVTRTFNQATTAYTNHYVTFTGTNAQPVDFTIRFYLPQIEQGATASSPIPTLGAAVTRAADVLSDGTYPNNPAQVFYAPVSTGVQASQVIDWTNIGSLQNVWLREVRIYPIGWFRPVPAHSVDYTNGKLGPSDIFSRAGQAMVWDSTGQLTYAPNNLLLRSREFGGTGWVGLGGSAVTGTTTTPDGAVNVNIVTANGGNGFYQGGISFVAGMKYVLSAYVKGFTAGDIQLVVGDIFGGGGDRSLRINGQTGAFVSKSAVFTNHTIEAAGNGYWRISVTFTSAISAVAAIAVYGVSVGQQYAATWLQLEAVTYQTAPRDYNLTTTAAYYGARFEFLPDPHQYYDEAGKIAYVANQQLAYTTDLTDNTNWPSTNIAARTGGQADPFGGTTAALTTANGVSGLHSITSPLLTPTQGGQAIFSAYVKYSTQQWLQLRLSTNIGGGKYYNFDIQNGVIGSGNTANKGIEAVGNGWYRVWIIEPISALLGNFGLYWVTASNSASAESNTASGAAYIAAPLVEFVGASQTTPRAYIANTTGNPYWAASVNQPQGLLAEEARTNSNRNSTMQGGLAGSPGTAPTNWAINNIGTLTQTLAYGTEFGMPYTEIRLSGTTSTTNIQINFEGGTVIAAANGQTWNSSFYVRMSAGSQANITGFSNVIVERNSSGTALASTGSAITLSSSLERKSFAKTLNQATTAFVNTQLQISTPAGVAVDITLRVYQPQVEQGATASSPILTYGAAVTRAADVWTLGALTQAIVAGGYGAVIVEAMRPFNMTTSSRIFDSAGLSLSSNGASEFYLSGNVANAAVTPNAPFVAGQLFRIGATWSPGRFSICANGGNVGTSPCVRATPGAITYMGDNSTDIRSFNGYFRKVSWFAAPVNDNYLKLRTAIGGLWQ